MDAERPMRSPAVRDQAGAREAPAAHLEGVAQWRREHLDTGLASEAATA